MYNSVRSFSKYIYKLHKHKSNNIMYLRRPLVSILMFGCHGEVNVKLGAWPRGTFHEKGPHFK